MGVEQGVRPAQYDFFDLKGIVEGLAADLHLPGVGFRATTTAPWLHPGRSAELTINGKPAGVLGELHPKVAASFGKEFAERAVQVAELDLEAILAAVPDRFPYRPFSILPAAKRDVAVVVPTVGTTSTPACA